MKLTSYELFKLEKEIKKESLKIKDQKRPLTIKEIKEINKEIMKNLKISQEITIKNIFTKEIIIGIITSIKKTEDYTKMIIIKSKEFSIVLSEHTLYSNYEIVSL